MAATRGTEGGGPLRVSSVVGLAYDAIREMIVAGALAPGARVGQAEVAEQLGVSRGPVREALRRLAGDGLVEFEVNRGFFVADLGLERVLERLEARLLLEPELARLAAGGCTDADLEALLEAVAAEESADGSDAAHDASRTFHLLVARATGNPVFVTILESLWIADVGRRLLAQRITTPSWQQADADEHRLLVAALAARDGERAAALMRHHVEDAFRHWSGRARGQDEAEP